MQDPLRARSTKKDRHENAKTSKVSAAINAERSNSVNVVDLSRTNHMTKSSPKLEQLLKLERWPAAEKTIRTQLQDQPENHWLLTQLGSVLYEQRKYKASLTPLIASFRITPDCPLTLWHLAGTYDALGQYDKAISIYAWILNQNISASEDPCWESQDWSNSLKTDCVYRIAHVLEHQKNWTAAAEYYAEYLKLQLAGMHGSYSIADAAARLSALKLKDGINGKPDAHQAFSATLRRTRTLQGKRNKVRIAEMIAS